MRRAAVDMAVRSLRAVAIDLQKAGYHHMARECLNLAARLEAAYEEYRGKILREVRGEVNEY